MGIERQQRAMRAVLRLLVPLLSLLPRADAAAERG